jgi:hypothetical protein
VLNGNDFMFLVRPWYENYPPVSSFTGTVRCSAFSMKHNRFMFAYGITKTFAQAYWKNKFPSTLFFLDTCHGTDPAGLPGMPTYVLNNGALGWVGWNGSVSFISANEETKLFFSQMALGKNIGEALNYVMQKNYPDKLTLFPAQQSQCRLGRWYWHSQVPQQVARGDCVDNVQVCWDGGTFYVRVEFWAAHDADNEFQINVNAVGGNGAKVRIICHLNNFQVYKESAPGVYDTFLLRGVPYKMFNNQYLAAIPWNETFGNATGATLAVYTAVNSPNHDYFGNLTLNK